MEPPGSGHWVVEGFEDDLVTLELPDRRTLDLPRAWLPAVLEEGDHLSVEARPGTVTFTLDREAGRAAVRWLDGVRARMRAHSADDGGDVEL